MAKNRVATRVSKPHIKWSPKWSGWVVTVQDDPYSAFVYPTIRELSRVWYRFYAR